MASELEPDGASIAPGILAPVGADALAVRDPVHDQRVRDIQVDAAAVRGYADELQSLVNESIAASYGESSLAIDQIEAMLRSQVEVPVTLIAAHGNKIGEAVVRSLYADVERAAPLAGKAGLSADYPNWERMLYRELPPTDALRAATYLRANTALDDSQRAELSAQITMGMPDALDAAAGAIDPDKLPLPPIRLPEPPHAPPAPDQTPIPFPTAPPEQLPLCSATGPCGQCIMPDGRVVTLGRLPSIEVRDGPMDAFPTDADILACREAGALGMYLDVDSGRWVCHGQGKNYCDEPLPPPPPPTTEPGCPVQACPVTEAPVYVAMPPGSVVVGPGQCAPGGAQESTSAPGGGYSGPGAPATATAIGSPVSVSVDVPPPAVPPPYQIPSEPAQTPISTPCFAYNNHYTVCDDLIALAGQGGIAGTPNQTTDDVLIEALGDGLSWIKKQLDGVANYLFGNDSDASHAEAASIKAWSTFATNVLGGLPECEDACDKKLALALAGRVGAQNKLEQVTGIPSSYFVQSCTYAYQYLCPQFFPSQGGIDQLYVNGVLTRGQYYCYTRANGNLPDITRELADLSRARPSIADVNRLFALGVIDENDKIYRLRQLGVMQAEDGRLIEEAAKSLPSPEAIVTLMTRDVADEEAVKAGQLDNEFELKYTGILKTWAKANGVTDEAMRFAWRAHWKYPSPSQLYRMQQQLREGRVAPELVVTEQDVINVLGINDVAPAWREKLAAISFDVPTRMDMKQAYFIDSINENELSQRLQDIGYSATDADFLVQVFGEEKRRHLQAEAARYSPWTAKKVLRSYAAGEINLADAYAELQRLQVPEDRIPAMAESARLQAVADGRKQCIRGVRHKYLIGDFTDDTAVEALSVYGLDIEQANTLVTDWKCQLLSRAKEIGADKNVNWFARGIIGLEELTRRLINLGYNDIDSNAYIIEAVQRFAAERQKEQEKILKAQEAAERKRQQRLREAEKERVKNCKAWKKANPGQSNNPFGDC